MSERASDELVPRTLDTFVPNAPDAVRMCSECGEVKICTSFPAVTGQAGVRYGECRACRDVRRRGNDVAWNGSGMGATSVPPSVTDVDFGFADHMQRSNAARDFAVGGRREALQARRAAVADAVRTVIAGRAGQAMSIYQVHVGVIDRLDFVPAEADVRDSLRELVKSDERCVKLGRDALAWVLPGAEAPPPPAPPHVVEMIERRRRGLTLDEIGREFGVTRERVRQLLKKHGGPSAKEIRDLLAVEARSTQRARAEAVSLTIREALDGRGPMTVAEMVNVTGLDANDVSRNWPDDLAHLRLWGAGQGCESRWTDEDICEALRQAAVYEFPLTTTAYSELLQVGQIDGPSVPRIGQRFGSWTAACAAAGVVAGDPWKRAYESKWSDDDLLQIVRAYLIDPSSANSAHRFNEWKRENAPDGPSAQTLRNRFGSWTEVKRRALAQGGPAT